MDTPNEPQVGQMETPNEPQYWLDIFRNELYKEVISWWLQFSLDTVKPIVKGLRLP